MGEGAVVKLFFPRFLLLVPACLESLEKLPYPRVFGFDPKPIAQRRAGQ
jgi:hypothetical protein